MLKRGWTLISDLRLSGRLLGNCLGGLGFCDGWGDLSHFYEDLGD